MTYEEYMRKYSYSYDEYQKRIEEERKRKEQEEWNNMLQQAYAKSLEIRQQEYERQKKEIEDYYKSTPIAQSAAKKYGEESYAYKSLISQMMTPDSHFYQAQDEVLKRMQQQEAEKWAAQFSAGMEARRTAGMGLPGANPAGLPGTQPNKKEQAATLQDLVPQRTYTGKNTQDVMKSYLSDPRMQKPTMGADGKMTGGMLMGAPQASRSAGPGTMASPKDQRKTSVIDTLLGTGSGQATARDAYSPNGLINPKAQRATMDTGMRTPQEEEKPKSATPYSAEGASNPTGFLYETPGQRLLARQHKGNRESYDYKSLTTQINDPDSKLNQVYRWMMQGTPDWKDTQAVAAWQEEGSRLGVFNTSDPTKMSISQLETELTKLMEERRKEQEMLEAAQLGTTKEEEEKRKEETVGLADEAGLYMRLANSGVPKTADRTQWGSLQEQDYYRKRPESYFTDESVKKEYDRMLYDAIYGEGSYDKIKEKEPILKRPADYYDNDNARSDYDEMLYDSIYGEEAYEEALNALETDEDVDRFDAQMEKMWEERESQGSETEKELSQLWKEIEDGSIGKREDAARKEWNRNESLAQKQNPRIDEIDRKIETFQKELDRKNQIEEFYGMKGNGSKAYNPDLIGMREAEEQGYAAMKFGMGDMGGDEIDKIYFQVNHPEIGQTEDQLKKQPGYKDTYQGPEIIKAAAETYKTDVNLYKHMSQKQVDKFNELYGNGTPEEKAQAKAFIDALTPTLRQMQYDYVTLRTAEDASGKYGALYGLKRIMTQPFAGLSGTAGTIAALFGNKEAQDKTSDFYKLQHVNNVTQQTRAKEIGKAFGRTFGKGAEGIGEFAANVFYSMADNAVSMALAGGISGMAGQALSSKLAEGLIQFIMSSESTSSAMLQGLENDMNPTETALTAIGSGLIEAITEKYSIEALLGADVKELFGKKGQFAKYVLKNMLAEGTEEVASDVLGIALNEFMSRVYGHESDIQKRYNEVLQEVKDPKEASKIVLTETLQQMGTSFLAGALSGGIMSGGRGIIARGQLATEDYRIGKKALSNEVKDSMTKAEKKGVESKNIFKLLEAAKQMDPHTKSNEMAYAILNDIKSGKDVNTRQLGEMVRSILRESNEQIGNITKDVLGDAFEDELKNAGDKNAAELSDILVKMITGGQITADEMKLFARSQKAIGIVAQFGMPDTYTEVKNELKERTKELASIRDTTEDMIITPKERTQMDASYAEMAEGILATDEEIGQAEGEATKGADEIITDGKIAKIVGFRDGKVQLEDGTEIDISDVKATGMAGAKVLQFASLDKNTRGSDRFNNTLLEMSKKHGPKDTLLSDAMKIRYATMLGRETPRTNLSDEDANAIREATKKDYEEARKKKLENPVRMTPGQGKASFNGAEYGTDAWNQQTKKLKAEDRVMANAIAEVTKAAGITTTIINDPKNDAMFGNAGATGIIINLAGKEANGNRHNAMVTFGHEITHILERNSIEGYESLKSYVLQMLAQNGMNVEQRIDHIMALYEREGEHLDLYGAIAEVVANGCDQVLSSQQAINHLQQTNASLYGKIKGVVTDLYNRIKNAIEGMKGSASWESKLLMNNVEGIAQRFNVALSEAAEAGQKVTEAEIATDGENQYLFAGKDPETGRSVYIGNFEKGTQKTKIWEHTANLVQNVWSKKPIQLMVYDKNKLGRSITAVFDPEIDKSQLDKTKDKRQAKMTPGGEIAYVQRGSNKEKRVMLHLSDDYYDILQESHYNGKKADLKGNQNVKQWNYFVDDIYFVEKGSDIAQPYRIQIDVQERNDGSYVYTYRAINQYKEQQKKLSFMGIGPVNAGSNIAAGESATASKKSIAQGEETGKRQNSLRDVEEAAEKAMPDSVIRDESGKLKPVYHGTNADFNVFDTSVSGGQNGTAEGFGIYLTDDPEVSGDYGNRQIAAYLNMKRPAYGDQKTIKKRELANLIKKTCERQAQNMVDEEGYDSVKDALPDTWISNYIYTPEYRNINDAYAAAAEAILGMNDNDADIVREVMAGMGIRDYAEAMDFYHSVLTPVTGIDGIAQKWTNKETGKVSNIYLAFDSSQIKSNEEVTYDDQGKPIPLSERFNPENEDIRYSIRDMEDQYETALKNKDTKAEQELVDRYAEEKLKDSKIRLKNGKLRKVYHGTFSDTFTVFDKKLIGTAREGDTGFFGEGFYFAFSKGEASAYGSNVMEVYLDIKNPFNFETELNTYDGKRSWDYNASAAVFAINWARKFPKLANFERIGVAKEGNDKISSISMKQFADEFEALYKEKEFRIDEVEGYNGKEWVVLADPKKETYTDSNGKEHTFTYYDFQKKFYSEEEAKNRINQVYEYMAEKAYDYIRIPASATIVMSSNLTDELKSRGYDGVIQSEDGDEIVAFESSQIKSADPVTYDDNGNVIPLSERFNQKQEDIRYSIRDVTNLDVGLWMNTVNRESLQSEAEKRMLDEYRNLRTRYELYLKRAEEARNRMREIKSIPKENRTQEQEKMLQNLSIREQNALGVAEKALEKMNQAEGDEGFARLMYQQRKIMETHAYAKTQSEVRDSVEAMERNAQTIQDRITKNQAVVDEIQNSGIMQKVKGILGITTADKVAEDLRKHFNSSWTKKQIRNYLDPILLKMSQGEDFSGDIEQLASEMIASDKSRKIDELEPLRGLTITIGPGQMAELKGRNSNLEEIRRRLAGTGIRIQKGEYSSLERDIDDLRQEFPQIPELGNEKDALENFVRWVEGLKDQSSSEFYAEALADAIGYVAQQAASASAESGIYIPADSKARQQVLELVEYIKGLQGVTDAAQRTLTQVAEQMGQMTRAGKAASNRINMMAQDVNVAIDYYNRMAQMAEDTMRKQRTTEIIQQLKSEQAQKMLKVNEEWRDLIERDRQARKQMEVNARERGKINTNVTRLYKLLNEPKGSKNIPEELQGLAREIIGTFVGNDLGGGLKITKVEKKQLEEAQRRLYEWEKRDGSFNIGDLNEGDENAPIMIINQDMQTIYDTLEKYNNGTRGKNKLDTLQQQGEILKEMSQAVAEIAGYIKSRREITLKKKKVAIENQAYKVMEGTRGRRAKEWTGKIGGLMNSLHRGIISGNMTPEYFFRNLRNEGLSELWDGYHDAENRNGLELKKAQTRIGEIAEKHGYKNWDMKQKVTLELESGKVDVTLGQLMSLYAIWNREHTLGPEMSQHLEKGGFYAEQDTRDGLIGRQESQKRAYKVTKEDAPKIFEKLTDEQKNFVNDIVGYMSKDMSQLGNEASMAAYGIKMYKESYYFPMQMWDGIKSRKSNEGAQAAAAQDRAFHPSFSKSRMHGAQNALVIGDFMQTATDHITGMINYATMGLANENFQKVLNAQMVLNEGEKGSMPNIRTLLEEAYGREAMNYLAELQKQLNGGAVKTTKSLGDKAIGLFRKNAVAGSLSVAAQQPLSYIRAAMMVNPKYLARALSPDMWKGSYQEMIDHSGVAVIKDMGRFDMNFGQSAREFLMPEGKEGKAKSTWGWITDKATILPEMMDRMTWTRMWSAVKAEMMAEDPKADHKSDEFLDKVGERFNELMRRTQVYDSTLVKSQNMRSDNYWIKNLTSFMAEPTLTMNVLADAVSHAKEKGGMVQLAKAGATFLLSAVLQAAVKAGFSSGRSPDKKKNWEENFLYRFAGNIISEVDPMTLIPGYSDIVTILKDGKLEDDAMGAIGKIFTAGKTGIDMLLGNGKNGVYRDIEDSAGQLVQLFTNLPVKNIMRDARAMYNWITGSEYAARGTDANVLRYQTMDAIFNADNILGVVNQWLGEAGYDTSNKGYYKRVYDAMKAGNETETNNLIDYLLTGKGVKKTSTIVSQVQTLIKEDYEQGGIGRSEAEKLLKKNKPGIKQADIMAALDEIDYEKKTGEDIDNYSNYTPIKDAIDKGQSITEAKKHLVQNGYKESDVNSQIRSYITGQYREGEYDRKTAEDKLKQYAGMEANDIWFALDKVDYKIQGGTDESDVYYRLNDAINSNSVEAIRTAIKGLMDHGYDQKQLKKKLSDWKKDYLSATGNDKVQLKNALIMAYKAIGISETEANNIINKWVKDNEKDKKNSGTSGSINGLMMVGSTTQASASPEAKKQMMMESMYRNTEGELYGKGNIDLNKRKVVWNPDGSFSTEASFSVNIDGMEVLLPTVINGKIVSEEEAIEHYFRTGEYLGKFKTVKEAEEYAMLLHERQEWYYGER